MGTLYAVTPPIGGSELGPAGCVTTSINVPGAIVGMAVSVTPTSYPGTATGIYWQGFVSAPDTVTVKVCTVQAGLIEQATYVVAVNTDTGGPGGGFPTVVAAINLTGQSGSQTITLLASPVTGDYSLNDYMTVLTPDPSTGVTLGASWADESGPQTGAAAIGNAATGNISITAANFLDTPVPGEPGRTPGFTIHAVAGTPIQIEISAIASGVQSATPTLGNAGLLYALGDTGTINNLAGVPATYQVTGIGAGGAVTSVTVTFPGSGFSVSTGNTTTVTTGAGDGTLELDITAIAPSLFVYDYHVTLIRNQ